MAAALAAFSGAEAFLLLLVQIRCASTAFGVDQSLIADSDSDSDYFQGEKTGLELIKTGRYGLGGGGDTPSQSNTDVFSEFRCF